VLRVRNLQVEKSGRAICRVSQLDVSPGEIVAIVGPNGSGKSTLLRVIAGLETEFTGEVTCDAPPKGRVYVHQSPYLFRGSVLYNVRYGLAACGVSRRKQLQAARQWLDALDASRLAARQTGHLSGGERRRVALARALAIGPPVLLLDEPLADLDEQGAASAYDAIGKATQKKGSPAAVIIATPTPLPGGRNVREFELPPAYRSGKSETPSPP